MENLLASPDGQSFSWDETPDADSYDAVRGGVVDLRFGGNLSHAGCLAKDLVETSLTDPEIPLRSDAFLYLVHGEAEGPASRRLGTWGSMERDESIDACPRFEHRQTSLMNTETSTCRSYRLSRALPASGGETLSNSIRSRSQAAARSGRCHWL